MLHFRPESAQQKLSMLRYIIFYILLLTLCLTLLKLPISGNWIDNFCLLLAQISWGVMVLFDGEIIRNGDLLMRKTYPYAIQITKMCSALESSVTVALAVIFYPACWWVRLLWCVLAIVLIQFFNVLRIISLVYGIYLLDTHHFNFLHEQLWIFLLVLLCIGSFASWILWQLQR